MSHDSWWGMIERPDPSNGRVVMYRSPVCTSEADLVRWKRETWRAGDELHLWRREATGGAFRDVNLSASDGDAMPDMARLAEILAPARAALDAAAKLRPVRGMPERSAIPVEARARMDAAVAAAEAACSDGGETPEAALPSPPVRADLA